MEKDIAYDLAKYIVETRVNHIPSEVIDITKRFILDSLAVAVAGSTAPGSRETIRLIENWGGAPESTIFVSGKKVPAPQAAFVNGMLIHSRDFDDTHDVAVIHANAAVLPSALAAAEQRGGTSGSEFLTAMVVGIDLACRLGLALRFYKGWHYSAICGGFGAAAAASKILGLNEKLTLEALGIVYSQIAGNVQCVRDGSLTKRMQLGFSAKAGILSAYLANIGITGTKNTFQGPYGFFRLYDDGDDVTQSGEKRYREFGEYGQHELLKDLGSRFEGVNLSMKPYPSCRATHPTIEGVLEICREEGIEADQVKQVRVIVSERTYDRVGRPLKIDDGPLQVKAQFSLPYTVAVAICKRDVFVEDFEEKNIRNEQVVNFAQKVMIVVDEKRKEYTPVRIEIDTIHGNHYSNEIHHILGSPETPLNEGQMLKKVKKCFQFSDKLFSNEKIEQIMQAVRFLENLKDVREILKLLS